METVEIYKLKEKVTGLIKERSEAFEELMEEIINKEMDYSTIKVLTKVYEDANNMPLQIIEELIKKKLEKTD